jgi:hypothetical protein
MVQYKNLQKYGAEKNVCCLFSFSSYFCFIIFTSYSCGEWVVVKWWFSQSEQATKNGRILCFVSLTLYMCVGRTIDRRAGAAIKAARCRQCEAMACEGWRSSSPISEIVSNANTPPTRQDGETENAADWLEFAQHSNYHPLFPSAAFDSTPQRKCIFESFYVNFVTLLSNYQDLDYGNILL